MRRSRSIHDLATDVGAQWHDVQAHRPAEGLIDFARRQQITQIVLGSSRRSRWQELRYGGSIVRKVQRMAGDAGIDVHTIARRQLPYEPGASDEA